jgi:hypothetical protein
MSRSTSQLRTGVEATNTTVKYTPPSSEAQNALLSSELVQ